MNKTSTQIIEHPVGTIMLYKLSSDVFSFTADIGTYVSTVIGDEHYINLNVSGEIIRVDEVVFAEKTDFIGKVWMMEWGNFVADRKLKANKCYINMVGGASGWNYVNQKGEKFKTGDKATRFKGFFDAANIASKNGWTLVSIDIDNMFPLPTYS
jgi:hypothetical protein